MSRQTRQRQLAQARARREAERRAARRRRARITYGALAGLVVVVAVAATLILRGGDEPAAPATEPTPTPLDARADAPTAPAAVACGGTIPPRKPKPTFDTAPPVTVKAGEKHRLVFDTSCGSFTVELDAASAPTAVSNLLFLASKGFYDSTWFHRIVPGDEGGIGVIQGGDPQGDGTGGPGYRIKEEPPKGPDPYRKYTVAMAKAAAPNSTGSQFFINTRDNPSSVLASDYSLVGTVTEGRDVIDRIAGVSVEGETPLEAVWIEKVTVQSG